MNHNLIAAILFALLASTSGNTQSVGINTSSPANSAVLDIASTEKGMLVPRMTTAQRIVIASPVNGLLVFDTDTNTFWFFQNSLWTELKSAVALKSVDGSTTFTTVPLNPNRYIWEISSSFPAGTTIPISENVINELCGDEDGCKVTITMSNWAANELAASSASCNMFYNRSLRKWRTNDGTTSGTDNNNAIEHLLTLHGNVYFTDGSYSAFSGIDNGAGFGLMKWNAQPPSTKASLIIED